MSDEATDVTLTAAGYAALCGEVERLRDAVKQARRLALEEARKAVDNLVRREGDEHRTLMRADAAIRALATEPKRCACGRLRSEHTPERGCVGLFLATDPEPPEGAFMGAGACFFPEPPKEDKPPSKHREGCINARIEWDSKDGTCLYCPDAPSEPEKVPKSCGLHPGFHSHCMHCVDLNVPSGMREIRVTVEGWDPGTCLLCRKPEADHDDGHCPEIPSVKFSAEELAAMSCQQCGDTDDDCDCRPVPERE